jgi:hypothetical protein
MRGVEPPPVVDTGGVVAKRDETLAGSAEALHGERREDGEGTLKQTDDIRG